MTPGGGGTYLAYGGDFGPPRTPSDENFCQNGLVSADRTPHPALAEVKKMQQFAAVKPVALDRGEVEVTNWFDHVSLGDVLVGTWALRADDRVVASGELPKLDLAPRASRVVSLPLPAVEPAPGVEYRLDVSFRLARDTNWAKAGHEVAWEQLKLPLARGGPALDAGSVPPLTLRETADAIEVGGASFGVVVDRTSGLLRSLTFRRREVLAAPLVPDFWRAPVDNDRGNNLPRVSGVWRQAGDSFRPTAVAAERLSPGVVRVTASGTLAAVGAAYQLTYSVYGTGDVVVEADYDAGGRALPELPRFGLQARLVPGFERVAWYGPGPEESYADRNHQRVGLYASTVDAHHFRYSQPQETGNHAGARWVSLDDGQGVGLLATGFPEVSVNVSHFEARAMDAAAHHHDLQRAPQTLLQLDLGQRGLGGDDSWGALPHPEFRLDAAAYRYRVRLRAFDTSAESPMPMSKLVLP